MSSETSRSRTTWWPASVVTVVVLIDQIDTNLVAGALPYLQREWGFGDTAAGAIPTSVAVAALLLALPAGHLADRVVRTRMISTAVAWWSLITTVSALAVSFPVFFATRVVLAGADSIYGPAASSLLADYYEPERRGRVFASYSLAGFVGLGAGVAIGGVLSAALGWRSAFLATVVPGLAVSLLVRRLHEPGRGTSDRVPSSGAAVPPSGGSDARFVPRLREVARLAVVRRLMLAIALVFLGVSGVFFWLPSFFERVDGLDAGVAAAVAGGVILAGTVVGAVTGGLLADRRVAEDPAARVRLARRGLVSAAVVALPTLLADGVVVHAGGLLVASTLAGLSIPNLPAHAAEAVPAHIRGLAFSLLSVATALGGAFGPLLVGLVSDGTGSLSIALTPATGLLLAAGLAVPSARSSRGTDPARQRPGVGSGRSR